MNAFSQARREGGQGSHLAPGPVLLRGSILRLQVDIITLFFNLIVSLAQNCVSNISDVILVTQSGDCFQQTKSA